MFGMLRMIANSSIAWWVAPSGPTEMPPCAPPILTGRFEYAMDTRIWSAERHDANALLHVVELEPAGIVEIDVRLVRAVDPERVTRWAVAVLDDLDHALGHRATVGVA